VLIQVANCLMALQKKGGAVKINILTLSKKVVTFYKHIFLLQICIKKENGEGVTRRVLCFL